MALILPLFSCGCGRELLYDPTLFQEPPERYAYELSFSNAVPLVAAYLDGFGLKPSALSANLQNCFESFVGGDCRFGYTDGTVRFFAESTKAFARLSFLISQDSPYAGVDTACAEIFFFSGSRLPLPVFTAFGNNSPFPEAEISEDGGPKTVYSDDAVTVRYMTALPDLFYDPVFYAVANITFSKADVYRCYEFVFSANPSYEGLSVDLSASPTERVGLMLVYDESGFLLVRVFTETAL